MVAPAGKAPQWRITEEENKKQVDQQRRERRIRRSNEEEPARLPSIKVREALKKGKKPAPPDASANVANVKPTTVKVPAKQTASSAVAKTPASAKQTTKKAVAKTTGMDPNVVSSDSPSVDVDPSARRNLAEMLRADLGSSDEEDASHGEDDAPISGPTLQEISAAPPTSGTTTTNSSVDPSTLLPTSTCTPVDPPPTLGAGPPTSEPTSGCGPPTSDPTLPIVHIEAYANGNVYSVSATPQANASKRNQKPTSDSDDCGPSEVNEDVVDDAVSDDADNVANDDPCFSVVGKAER